MTSQFYRRLYNDTSDKLQHNMFCGASTGFSTVALEREELPIKEDRPKQTTSCGGICTTVRRVHENFTVSNQHASHSLLFMVVGISRISAAEAKPMVNHTLPIPQDDGCYITSLDVFHWFHCLVRQKTDYRFRLDEIVC